MTAVVGGMYHSGLGMGVNGLTPPTAGYAHSLGSPNSLSPSSPMTDPPMSPTSPRGGGAKCCGVCGDVAKSMHFGGLSCDSCKAFFRRSVQNNAYCSFTCPYERRCVIAVSSRKACQYCRFQKCLSIGMEKGWVMSEDERRKMMQQRHERRTRTSSHNHGLSVSVPSADCSPPLMVVKDPFRYALLPDEQEEVDSINSLYRKAYDQLPYDQPNMSQSNAAAGLEISSEANVMSTWMSFCKRISYYFGLFPEFSALPSADQHLLLRTATLSACIIMGSVAYDVSGKWPSKAISRPGILPNVTSRSVEQSKIVPVDLMECVQKFFKKFQRVCLPDETMARILSLVALYSPDVTGLQSQEAVQGLQEHYVLLLQRYLQSRFGENSPVTFAKIIVSLADIRELAERTAQLHLSQRAASVSGVATLGERREGAMECQGRYEDVKMETQDVVNSSLTVPSKQVLFEQPNVSTVQQLTNPALLHFIMQVMKSRIIEKNIRRPTPLVSLRPRTRRRSELGKREHRPSSCQEPHSLPLYPMPLSPVSQHALQLQSMGEQFIMTNDMDQTLSGNQHPIKIEMMSPSDDCNVDAYSCLSPSQRCSPPGTSAVTPFTPQSPMTVSPTPSTLYQFPLATSPHQEPPCVPLPPNSISPYSDSSSSSGGSTDLPWELLPETCSDMDKKVLKQILELVANFDSLENVSSLKEIIPSEQWQEFLEMVNLSN